MSKTHITEPKVSRIGPDCLFIDNSGCDLISSETVAAVRRQIRESWPNINRIKVLQDTRNVRQYEIDPDLFGGRDRDFDVVAAAWIVDPSMLYGMQRALHSAVNNHNIQLFDDWENARSWLRSVDIS